MKRAAPPRHGAPRGLRSRVRGGATGGQSPRAALPRQGARRSAMIARGHVPVTTARQGATRPCFPV